MKQIKTSPNANSPVGNNNSSGSLGTGVASILNTHTKAIPANAAVLATSLALLEKV